MFSLFNAESVEPLGFVYIGGEEVLHQRQNEADGALDGKKDRQLG